MTTAQSLLLSLVLSTLATNAGAAEPIKPIKPIKLYLWRGKPPGETKKLPPERDIYKPTDKKIAGRPIIKLANVSTPMLEIHRPPKEIDTGAAVVICPGGGHYILAYDLEGTEVAEWLNTIGVTGIVLKYRVPAREKAKRWRAAVEDAQRAISVIRSRASEWGLDPKRIGICGFSAGGEAAGLTAIFGTKKTYKPTDEHDKASSRPDFALLIYAAGFVKRGTTELREYIQVTKDTPPMFFAHANDDGVSSLNSLLLAAELKKVGVPTAVHLWAKGGHGYGLRKTEMPVTAWPKRCEEWLRTMELLVRAGG
jgi:acetyl esterase/lipase